MTHWAYTAGGDLSTAETIPNCASPTVGLIAKGLLYHRSCIHVHRPKPWSILVLITVVRNKHKPTWSVLCSQAVGVAPILALQPPMTTIMPFVV